MSPPGQLVAAADARQVAIEASTRIAAAIRSAAALRGVASIALSGGNTPREAYAELAQETAIAWSKVLVFWVDERAVPPSDERSNYAWARTTLLEPAAIPPSNVFRMAANTADLMAAAKDYEQVLRDHVAADAAGVPSFDIMVLGVGGDGHTASLFPGESTIDVADRLVAAVGAHGGLEARITLTAPVIQHAKQVLILAVGEEKRAALGRAWDESGDVHATPARLLRGCQGSVVWIVDRAAIAP
jgi:6-phosphogluconolactonase